MNNNLIELMDDMHLSSKELFNKFYIAMSNNDLSTAQSILNNNPELANQITNSENINELIRGVNERELQPKTDIDYFLDNLDSEFQKMIDNTIVKGLFDINTQYYAHNLVYYNNKGYYAKSIPPLGTLPTDVTYWDEYDIRGLQGYSGIALNLRYNWDSSISYDIGDVVIYQNKVWMALIQNINFAPNLNHYPWALIMIPAEVKKTPIQKEIPIDYPENSIWYKITEGEDIKQTIWSSVSTNPLYKYASGYFTIGNEIYICGGEDITFSPSKTVNAYNVLTKTWSNKADLPIEYATTNSNISIGTNGYLVGGEKGVTREFINNVYKYDSTNNTWSEVANIPQKGMYCSVSDSSNIYSITTYNENNLISKKCYKYTESSNTWNSIIDIPIIASSTTAQIVNNKLYVIGGIKENLEATGLLQCYDITTSTWSSLAPMNIPRSFLASFSKGNNIYALGGLSNEGYSLNNNEIYDITTNTWRTGIPMQYNRNTFCATTINERGYVLDGLNLQKSQFSPVVEEYKFIDASPNLSFVINISENETYTIPSISGGTFNYYIDWGDESISPQITTYNDINRTHTYLKTGEYTIQVYGQASSLQFGSGTNATNLLEILKCNLNFTDVLNIFKDCSNLTEIPEDIFYNSPDLTIFSGCFKNCSKLKNIPQKLFIGSPNMTTISSCFNACTSLTNIPSNLFDSNLLLEDISYCFQHLNIEEIPYGLFLFNVNLKYAIECFFGCVNLIKIPEAFFNPCINMLNYESIFSGCISLNTIQDRAFGSGTISAMNFNSSFLNCSKLEYIGIIDMSSATNMINCFNGCTELVQVGGFHELKVSFDVSDSINLAFSSLLNIINSVGIATTAQTANLGATNLAKLTQEQIAILTNKGWTVT